MGKLKKIVKNFTKYNNLLSELVKKNIKLKYRRSYLGILWTLIEPLLTMIVLTLVFGTFFNKGTKQFPVYVLTGRLLFSFFQSSTKAGLKAVSGNASMIKKVYVPKYIYVVSSVVSNFFIFLISLIVLVGVGIVLKVEPTIYLLQAVFPLLILLVMSLGTSLILATLSVFFRDIEYIWGVVCMLIMYASAIFYPVERIITNGNGWVFRLNPVYMCIANFRNAVLYGIPMDIQYTLVSGGVSLALLLIGVVLFYKKQDEFILYL
jgi:ABC-2 type transport system permease protein